LLCYYLYVEEKLSFLLYLEPRQKAVGVVGGVTAGMLKLDTTGGVGKAPRHGQITLCELVSEFVFKRWEEDNVRSSSELSSIMWLSYI
jgi:hypothetical protein